MEILEWILKMLPIGGSRISRKEVLIFPFFLSFSLFLLLPSHFLPPLHPCSVRETCFSKLLHRMQTLRDSSQSFSVHRWLTRCAAGASRLHLEQLSRAHTWTLGQRALGGWRPRTRPELWITWRGIVCVTVVGAMLESRKTSIGACWYVEAWTAEQWTLSYSSSMPSLCVFLIFSASAEVACARLFQHRRPVASLRSLCLSN